MSDSWANSVRMVDEMSTETSKPKAISSNGKSTNGASPKAAKPKKSMYEKWIETYGVSDSKADRLMLRTMKKIYEANSKSET